MTHYLILYHRNCCKDNADLMKNHRIVWGNNVIPISCLSVLDKDTELTKGAIF